MQFQTQPNPSLYSKKERGVGPSRIKDGGQKNNFLFVILFLKINNIKCLILYLIHMCFPHVHELTFRHLHVKIALIETILLAL